LELVPKPELGFQKKTNWTWEPDSLFHLNVELESRFLGEKKIEKKKKGLYRTPRTKGEEANQKLTTNSSLGYPEQGLILRTETKKPNPEVLHIVEP
jgi:hypothetical protein